ncbi:type II secretion system protein [bacterium]|nr:type II secretion system protein [bacterium]
MINEEQKARGQEGKRVTSLNTLSRICKFAYCSLTNSTLSQRERVCSKTAFTLAEVLITLGIIGVVAAMTLPAVIANHQSSVLQQRFKKAYSSMSQVFQRVAFEDYGGNMNIEYTQFGDIIEACNERIIKSSVCLYGQNNCDTTIFPFKNYEHPANIGNFLVSNYGITQYANFINDGVLALNDGTFVIFDNGDLSGKTLITIDTNGWRNKPNKGGVDFFMFELKSNGALVPVEDITPPYGISPLQRNTNCLSNPDVTCTYEALSNPDYFKKVKK